MPTTTCEWNYVVHLGCRTFRAVRAETIILAQQAFPVRMRYELPRANSCSANSIALKSPGTELGVIPILIAVVFGMCRTPCTTRFPHFRKLFRRTWMFEPVFFCSDEFCFMPPVV